MKNYHKYLRTEEMEWSWSYDQKTKIHTLVLIHLPTKKSVRGSFPDKRDGRSLSEKKHELQEQLKDQLEELVFE